MRKCWHVTGRVGWKTEGDPGMYPTRLAIIGCGAVGSTVARAVREGRAGDWHTVAVLDRPAPARAEALAEALGLQVAGSLEALIAASPQVVVEAASVGAVGEYLIPLLEAGCDVVVLSTGGLVEPGLRTRAEAVARRVGRRIFAASGALGGLDLVAAANLAPPLRVTLTTRKPPRALGGKLEGFAGSAAQAVAVFPQNLNVAATLALAAQDPGAVEVRVEADPSLRVNTHRVALDGPFGSARLEVSCLPLPDNPRTSWLAALSVLAVLRRLQSPLWVG